jgi:nanoRNase/pAp phosphatase (c-di-AMP/oligoRNAs hydrolase)
MRMVEGMDKIDGKGFVIVNTKDKVRDAIVGTLCSMLSASPDYQEGTILVGMAYNENKIKVSARMAGRNGRNLKELMEKTVTLFRHKNPETSVEVGGHQFAAGCLVEREKEEEFISALKENLEVEVMKI